MRLYSYAMFTLILWAAPVAVSGESGAPSDFKVLKKIASDERKLLAALDDTRLWKQAGPRTDLATPGLREAELLGYLKAAQLMRSQAVIRVLIDNIAFNLYEGIATKKQIPTDVMYPAYATLKAIGVPVIPALLEHLKAHDPLDEKQRRSPAVAEAKKRQYGMVWMCITEIYAENKFFRRGIPYAMLRIRFEIDEIRKKTGVRNSPAEMRLQRVIKDMQKVEEFFDRR